MKYSLDLFRKKLPFKISSNTAMDNIKSFSDDEDYQGNIDFDVFLPTKNKKLQRDFVWTEEQKSELILSVLKGAVIPAFSVVVYKPRPGCDYNERVIKVIDGKQRFSTLISFYRNEFPLLFEGNKIYYNDLDEDAQRTIWNFTPTFNIAYESDAQMITDDEKIAWFEMINFKGTPQDAEHLKYLKS